MGLNVLKDLVQGDGLLTEVSDNGNRGALNLADSAVSVELGQTDPLSDLDTLVGQDQRNTLLSAKSLDKLLVLSIVAVAGQDAEAAVATLQLLGAPDK